MGLPWLLLSVAKYYKNIILEEDTKKIFATPSARLKFHAKTSWFHLEICTFIAAMYFGVHYII